MVAIKYQGGSSTMLRRCYTTAVITAIVANLVLSVDALRCHQCNSHLDEDCNTLRLSTPRAPRDNQYLKECEGDYGSDAVPFCRKTVVHIEVNEEHRIVRSCGWIHDSWTKDKNSTCYTADNEGYLQTICSCAGDGCNAAPSLGGDVSLQRLVGVAGGVLLVTAALRRSAH